MSFNQWCAGKSFDTQMRLAFEAIWKALVGGGNSPAAASPLLSDLVRAFPADREEDWD